LLIASSAIAQEAQFDGAAEQQLAQLVNQSRAEQGLRPLAIDPRLIRAARQHTALMVAHKELLHQYPDEETLTIRVSGENLRSDRQGENIALNGDAISAHLSLMRSPGHRANILNPEFNALGIGIVQVGNDIYVTEDFAHRLPDYSEHEADAVLQHALEKYTASRGVPPPARKPQPRLHDLACKMALNDHLDGDLPSTLPGVHAVVEWTATELEILPSNAKGLLAQPSHGGYSLGVCFAPSISRPAGAYWVVMVAY
jgi:hypothetical protein